MRCQRRSIRCRSATVAFAVSACWRVAAPCHIIDMEARISSAAACISCATELVPLTSRSWASARVLQWARMRRSFRAPVRALRNSKLLAIQTAQVANEARASPIITAFTRRDRGQSLASNASAMPGATTARLVVCARDMPIKLSMIPQTVPNSPTALLSRWWRARQCPGRFSGWQSPPSVQAARLCAPSGRQRAV
jgi:hypothetical protein